MKISTTGSADLPRHLKILLTGSPKSGKTSFIGTIPNILVADTEQHANNLQSIAHKNVPFVAVNSSDDLRDLLMTLRDPIQRQKAEEELGRPIEAVAIDTLDSFQEILKRERLKETRQTSFKRDDWSWLLETMTTIVQSFCSLPMHVVFAVHSKIQSLGSDDDPRSIVLPALNGQMSERIAGMVGYSLGTFRVEEIGKDGAPRTVYWIRTEGDEVHPHLGNRSAGRLAAVIKPSFQVILDSLPETVDEPIQTHVETDSGPASEPVPEETPVEEPEAEQPGEPETPEVEAVEEPEETLPEPVNATALSHLQKVWKALDRPFPAELIEEKMSLDEARDVVVFWQALSKDAADGKVDDPKQGMCAYLIAGGWMAEPADEEPAEDKPKRRTKTATVKAPKVDPVTEVADSLGAEVIDIREGSKTAPCEVCGNPVDDKDIAALAQNRFGQWLCVDDYRTANKK